MDDTLLKQIQQTELEIASEIFRICRKHQLRCSLVGGSAIGAVRHHGFIPWDDDIDLAMPRKDYERFSSLCKEELSENYFLQDFDTEENCAYIFAKVRKNDTYMPEEYSKHIKMHQGIWVDVFIYDNVSDNPKIRKREINQLALYRNLLILKTGFRMPRNKSGFFNRAVLYPIGKCCSSFFDASYLKRKCRQIMTRHQNENTKCVFPYGGAYANEKELMPANIFDELVDVQFNDKTFKLFKEYDRYLTSLFGDYMTPPPPEQRHANHYLDEKEFIV